MAGRSVLVKAVLTSVVISFITVLDVLAEVLLKIDIIRRAFLWAACKKVTGGKWKMESKLEVGVHASQKNVEVWGF